MKMMRNKTKMRKLYQAYIHLVKAFEIIDTIRKEERKQITEYSEKIPVGLHELTEICERLEPTPNAAIPRLIYFVKIRYNKNISQLNTFK